MSAVPRPLGGASFLRAAHDWGFALRLAGTARALPFALARDPYPTEAYVFASALGASVAERVFARRKLGLTARGADVHVRELSRTLFMRLRTIAAELVAGVPPSTRTDELEELTSRLFGVALPPPLAEAWSYGGFGGTSRVDAPARFLGALRSQAFVRDLVNRFDEDWFDNPRAAGHLANVSVGPVWQESEGEFGVAERQAIQFFARAFEEKLG
jgi:hypothetical protein